MKTTDKKLHIVSINIPWPPDYGGIIDIYYKPEVLDKKKIAVIKAEYLPVNSTGQRPANFSL